MANLWHQGFLIGWQTLLPGPSSGTFPRKYSRMSLLRPSIGPWGESFLLCRSPCWIASQCSWKSEGNFLLPDCLRGIVVITEPSQGNSKEWKDNICTGEKANASWGQAKTSFFGWNHQPQETKQMWREEEAGDVAISPAVDKRPPCSHIGLYPWGVGPRAGVHMVRRGLSLRTLCISQMCQLVWVIQQWPHFGEKSPIDLSQGA